MPSHACICVNKRVGLFNHQLDIVQQEYINDCGLVQIELAKAAFGCFGAWLATVEQRQEREGALELQMKLWAYNKKTQG